MGSLRSDIEDVFVEASGLGPDENGKIDKGKIPELAKGLALAVERYVKSLTFNITTLDAPVILDEMKFLKDIPIDLMEVGQVNLGPVASAPTPLINLKLPALPPTGKIKRNTVFKNGMNVEAKGKAYLGKAASAKVQLKDPIYDRTNQYSKQGEVKLNPTKSTINKAT